MSRYALTQDQINSLTDDQAYSLRCDIQDEMAHLGSIEHMLFIRKRIQDINTYPELILQAPTPKPNKDLTELLTRAIDQLGPEALNTVANLLTQKGHC